MDTRFGNDRKLKPPKWITDREALESLNSTKSEEELVKELDCRNCEVILGGTGARHYTAEEMDELLS